MSDEHTEQSRIAALEADNRRLRLLLDKRDAPGELRHRLRGTVALLRTIVRRTAHTNREFDDYVGHVEDRLDALMRAQSAADERGSVDLHGLVEDEFFHYGIEVGARASITGPRVALQAKAGQVLALAVHELVINGIEHGALAEGGQVDIMWTVSQADAAARLALTWTEPEAIARPDDAADGFGTEVLTRMLPYELDASADLRAGPGGLRFTAEFPLSARVGQLSPDQPAA